MVIFGGEDLDFLIYFLHFFFLSVSCISFTVREEERECVSESMEGVSRIRAGAFSSILEDTKSSAWIPETKVTTQGCFPVAPPLPFPPPLFPPPPQADPWEGYLLHPGRS